MIVSHVSCYTSHCWLFNLTTESFLRNDLLNAASGFLLWIRVGYVCRGGGGGGGGEEEKKNNKTATATTAVTTTAAATATSVETR